MPALTFRLVKEVAKPSFKGSFFGTLVTGAKEKTDKIKDKHDKDNPIFVLLFSAMIPDLASLIQRHSAFGNKGERTIGGEMVPLLCHLNRSVARHYGKTGVIK
jgi:hypothetical protein